MRRVQRVPPQQAQDTVHPNNEQGRKLYAAALACALRRNSIDDVLKTVPAVVDPSWSELAFNLVAEIGQSFEDRVFAAAVEKKPFLVK